MAMIKCSECGREIDNEASACMYCGNPIGKTNSYSKSFNSQETEKTITSLLELSRISLGLSIVLGIFVIILGLMLSSDGGIILLVLGFALMLVGFLLKVVFMWMAYMLRNIYEINVNTKR